MDFNSLKDQVSNLTLYDLKAGVRKVQNAVMNYTEMEAKVREATNNEPWGASSTIMQEIANGTFNYQTLNEIMPMIYRRFTEKAAEEWRQIYKALQLLEFLIKHGSERVIDDARGHITLLKMLRQFHYIDQNGKDQGINVRNRAKELAELLGDVERIRAERKKARTNKAKYTGVEGGAMSGFSGSGSSSRYGGFGSESGYGGGSSAGYGGYSGGVYGDGGGFGGQSDDWKDATTGGRADKFEEYDEFDEGSAPSSSSRAKRPERGERAGVKKTTPAEPPKKKEPEVDLFSFDDPVPATTSATAAPTSSNGSSALAALSTTNNNDDDDFDDFQSATPAPSNNIGIPPPMVTSSAQSTAQFAAPKPVSGPQQANLTDMMSSISPPVSSTSTPAANYSSFAIPTATSIPAQQPKPMNFQAATPNYYQSVQVAQPTGSSISAMSSASTSTPSGMSAFNKPAVPATSKPSAGGDPFANLWGQAGSGLKKTSTPTSGPKMGQLAKEKTSASLWGAPAAGTPKPMGSSQNTASGSSGLDDLLG
ncbi:ENTH-domain-containing protein [Hypoxylon rubiginosum]|uniref:ENTH-domain-containing protein n=1 Tax=Hypoxylon rubiginosum TaxID=110542 RepID=A0ACC0CQ09_9PEZI|nr:ENTH-domain-containing protein [Hypoxylon rubiginosum]